MMRGCLPALLLLSTLASGADLTLRLAALDYEDGPPSAAGYEYHPGETVWIRGRVEGFRRTGGNPDERDSTDQVRLSWQLRAIDPAGTLLAPPRRAVIEESLREEDTSWTPKLLTSFEIPAFAPRGTYSLAVTLRDELAKSDTTATLTLRVRGEEAPPKDAPLGIRNFRFLAKEDDRFPLRPAAYSRGSAIHTAFDVIGYAFQGNNRFDVEYGVLLMTPPNAEGVARPIFFRDTAASESQDGFYAQRWIPWGFELALDNEAPLGEYTLTISLRDKISGARAELRETFVLR
jgi:hypothetical protein